MSFFFALAYGEDYWFLVEEGKLGVACKMFEIEIDRERESCLPIYIINLRSFYYAFVSQVQGLSTR